MLIDNTDIVMPSHEVQDKRCKTRNLKRLQVASAPDQDNWLLS